MSCGMIFYSYYHNIVFIKLQTVKRMFLFTFSILLYITSSKIWNSLNYHHSDNCYSERRTLFVLIKQKAAFVSRYCCTCDDERNWILINIGLILHGTRKPLLKSVPVRVESSLILAARLLPVLSTFFIPNLRLIIMAPLSLL